MVFRLANDLFSAVERKSEEKSRFLKLDGAHAQHVMDCMKDNAAYVRNIMGYPLYNAPVIINSCYSSLVQHDLYGDSHKRSK